MYSLGKTPKHFGMRGTAIDIAVANAVAMGMNHIGETLGLEPLDWRLATREGASLEGVPICDPSRAAEVCETWAHAMDLDEYEYDVGDGVRSWYSADGEWHVEISTRR